MPNAQHQEDPLFHPLVEDVLDLLEDRGVPASVSDQIVKLLQDWLTSDGCPDQKWKDSKDA